MSKLDEILSRKLEQAHIKGSFRQLKHNTSLFDFCSNDYLGIASNKYLEDRSSAILKRLSHLNYGSGGSRLISGHHSFIDELEQLIAETHEAEASLVFNSGYNANMSVLSSIPQKGDVILYDELCHASIKDGMRLSFADRYSFQHNKVLELETKLEKYAPKQCYVVIESVYSMDGDLAPLKAIADLCERFQAILIVDEAHSTGTFGKNGSGLTCDLDLHKHIPIRIHTYGKALGCHGASVVGSNILKNYLINFSRQFIYTTALPLHSYTNIYAAYEYLKEHYKRLQQTLNAKQRLFSSSMLHNKDIICQSPIVSIIIGGNEETKTKAKSLQVQGFDVRAILSPTVPLGKERLRVCLHVFNSDESIIKLAKLISQ